jgi:uncharacterized protein involved in response to NO
MMFLAGAVQGLAIILWWSVELLGRYTSLFVPVAWSIPPLWAHAFLMIYGFFPFFVFGFLMTTYPNWMNGEKIPPRRYVPAFFFLAGGIALFYGGLFAGKWLVAGGVLLFLGGWGVGLFALLRVLFTARHPDKLHPAVTSVALALGWLGALSFLLLLLDGAGVFWVAAIHGGIWLFLVPILITVSHRMIPFFSSRVLENYRIVRPYWALGVMLAGAAGHGLLSMADRFQFLWLVDLPFLMLAAYFSYAWGFLRSFRVRLLAVLHIAFLWLSIALALYVVQSLARFSGGTQILGLAPLHALGIGFFASMILGMGARVTLGHSGRDLVADPATWALFLGFQFAAVARVLGDLPLPGLPSAHLYLLAAALWLACFIPWFVKYAPAYLRPRADGRPG